MYFGSQKFTLVHVLAPKDVIYHVCWPKGQICVSAYLERNLRVCFILQRRHYSKIGTKEAIKQTFRLPGGFFIGIEPAIEVRLMRFTNQEALQHGFSLP